MAIAALGVVAAYTAANETTTQGVYVAARDLQPGEQLRASDLSIVEIDPRGNGLGIYQPGGPLIGQYVNSPVRAGELFIDSVVTPAASWEMASEITLTIPASRALGGSIRADQRVDVYVTWSASQTQLVAANAQVLEVRSSSAGTLGGGSESITVRLQLVDPTVIDDLVHGQANADITLVRSTNSGTAGETFTPPKGDNK